MKKLLLIALILSAGIASAATKTCSGGPCSFSSGTNWSGGTAPVDGDLIVTGANTVTMDRDNAITGDVSGTGIGVSVSSSGGKFQCAANMHMTFRGTNTTTATFWTTVASSTMDLSNCVSVLYQGASDYASVGVNNGNYLDSATTVSDAAASTFSWSNSATMTISGQTAFAWDKDNGIYALKIGQDSGDVTNAGPVANSANTGLGSFGDTSISVTHGGFDSNGGTTHVEKSPCVQGSVLTTTLTTNGDFCADYKQGFIWYKSAGTVLTVTVAYKYGSWFGWGIWSTNNAANSAITLNGKYMHCGSENISSETSGMCIFADDKYAPGQTDTTRTLTFGTGFECDYFARCINITNDHITGSSSSHHYVIPSPVFNYGQYNSGIFQRMMIQLSSVSFLDVTSPTLNSYLNYMDNPSSRGPFDNIITTLPCGGSSIGSMLYFPVPTGATNSAFKSNMSSGVSLCANALSSFNGADLEGSAGDGSFISQGGTSGNINTYTDLMVSHPYRAGRLNTFMDVERTVFPYENHHGFVINCTGYCDMSSLTFNNNITYGFQDGSNFPGGLTSSYNQIAWVDGLKGINNTFNGETRCLAFNDAETTVAAVTKYIAYNNICSNNLQGIYRAGPSATSNVINLGASLIDWNDDFNNTDTPTNVLQGTFTFGGVNYNTSVSKTALGVYAFSPSYSLPLGTGKSIVLTVAGTAGVNKTITVQWGGGTAVSYVAALHTGQGALTSFAAGLGSNCASTNCPVLTDSLGTFPTSGVALQTYFVILTSGACSGKAAMIVSNTATALTVFSNTDTGSYAGCTPAATDTYIIVAPDQQIFDSGAVDSIRVQLNPLELTTTNGTYTDANITITKNYPGTSGADNGVDPQYVSAGTGNFIPKNVLLKGTGLGGSDIGALPVQGGTGCGLLMLLGVGC